MQSESLYCHIFSKEGHCEDVLDWCKVSLVHSLLMNGSKTWGHRSIPWVNTERTPFSTVLWFPQHINSENINNRQTIQYNCISKFQN